MDYRNNSDLSDQNTIIYGHNMKNATMFGTLQNYRNQDYYDEHKIMYYFTPTGNYLVKIATAYTASVESVLYKLTDLNQDNINNIMKQSNFKSEVSINESDKILTLSTCAYEYEDARFIVVGVLQPLSE